MSQRGDGVLIALEGIDGCGKSSQAARLAAALRSRGRRVSCFREPGDSEPGRELRRTFVQGRHLTPAEEVRLFLEDRRIDVRDNIAPALARGEVVLMDRYYLSSVAYQGALGMDPEQIRRDNEAIAPRPDLTLLLDLEPAVAAERIHAARGGVNSFEELAYQERVRELYLGYVDGHSVVRVDAERDPDAVHEEMLRHVLAVLEPEGAAPPTR